MRLTDQVGLGEVAQIGNRHKAAACIVNRESLICDDQYDPMYKPWINPHHYKNTNLTQRVHMTELV